MFLEITGLFLVHQDYFPRCYCSQDCKHSYAAASSQGCIRLVEKLYNKKHLTVNPLNFLNSAFQHPLNTTNSLNSPETLKLPKLKPRALSVWRVLGGRFIMEIARAIIWFQES